MELPFAEQVVLRAIKKWSPGCSFVNLLRELPPELRAGADRICRSSPTVVLWPEPVHGRVIEALRSLGTKGLIKMYRTSALTYRLDGAVFNMPLAAELNEHDDGGTRTTKWYPVVFDPVEE